MIEIFAQSDTVPPVIAASAISDTCGHSSDSIAPLERMQVHAGRYDYLMRTGQSITVIKPEMWEGSERSLADILADLPGIQTRRFGGRGSFQTVSIRGVEGTEVLVLMDGIPLNSALGEAVDLGKINPMRLQAIEVYRSMIPARYGGNSLGGVINLIGAKPEKETGADLYTQFGNYHSQQHQIVACHTPDDNRSLLGLLSFEQSDNDFPYLDRNNTVLGTVLDPTRDDTVRVMNNNQYSAGNLLLHPSFALGRKSRIYANTSVSWHRANQPAGEGSSNRTAYASEKNICANVRLVPLQEDKLVFEPALGYQFRNYHRFSTSLDDGVGASHATLSGPDSYRRSGAREHSLSLETVIRYSPRKWLTFESLGMISGDDINPYFSGSSGGHGDWHSSEASLCTALDAYIEAGIAALTIGGTAKRVQSRTEGGLDSYTMREIPQGDTGYTVWSVKSGAALTFFEKSGMLYVNGGRFSNHPSLRQRYGAQGAHNPNPTLRPEYGYKAEAGIKYGRRRLFWEVCGFYNRSYDKIITVFDGRQSASVNCSGALADGVETSLLLPLSEWLSTDTRFTLQHTENLAEEYNWKGRRLPGEPMMTLYQALTLSLPRGVSFDYGLDMRSYYYRSPANIDMSDRVPRYEPDGNSDFWEICHNARLEWQATENVRLTASAEDVTGQLLTSGEMLNTGESGYSLILVPANRFSATLMYSF